MTQNIIVVVDDEESLCELMAEVLSEHYVVYKAFNGKEALTLIEKHRPTLVISDIMMPRMTGVELLKALRENDTTRHIPVILLSAALTPSAQIDQQIAAFMPKPFEIEILEETVENALKTQFKLTDTTSDETVKQPLKLESAERGRDFEFGQQISFNQGSFLNYKN